MRTGRPTMPAADNLALATSMVFDLTQNVAGWRGLSSYRHHVFGNSAALPGNWLPAVRRPCCWWSMSIRQHGVFGRGARRSTSAHCAQAPTFPSFRLISGDSVMPVFTRVVVPIDGSAGAQSAVLRAIALAADQKERYP